MFKKLLALPLLLLTASSASAAFSFSISPAGNTLTTGGPVVLNVLATSTSPFEVMNITAVSIEYGVGVTGPGVNNSPFVVTTSNVVPSLQVASDTGNQIGTVSAAILPGFGNWANDYFRLRITTLQQGLNVTNFVQITAVPEPSSLALVGVVGFGMVAYRRRRTS